MIFNRKTSAGKVKWHREDGEECKEKKRKQSPDVYYPGMVAEAISGNLSNVSKVTNVLCKIREDGDNNSVALSLIHI